MKYNISNKSINVIVNELGEEYKDLLIERLLDETKSVDADQINPSDLIRLDVEAKANLRFNSKKRRYIKMYTITSLVGVIYALFGLMLFLWKELQYTIRNDSITLISILLIFLGLFVSILSIFMKYLYRYSSNQYREKRNTISKYEIINKWKEIEALIYQLNPENDQLSLKSMINNLVQAKIVSKEDDQVILQLLQTRNQVLHSKSSDDMFSQGELRDLLNKSNKIIIKLNKLI